MVLIDVDVPLWRRRLRRRRCRRRRPCPRRVWCRVNSFPRLRCRSHDCSGSSITKGVTYRQSSTAMAPRSTFAGSHEALAEILQTRTGRRLRGLPMAVEEAF